MYCLRDQVEQKKSDVHPPISNECKAQLRQEFYKQVNSLNSLNLVQFLIKGH